MSVNVVQVIKFPNRKQSDAMAANEFYLQEAESLRQYYVDSSNVKWAAYSESFGRLYVKFITRDKPTVYFDVPPDVWAAFQSAESKGTFIYDEIRGAKGKRADKSRGIPAPSLDYIYAFVNL